MINPSDAVSVTANEYLRAQSQAILRPSNPRPRPAQSYGVAKAEEVVKAFNSWAFKREQPDTPDLLRACVEKAMLAGRPVPFVLYWGRGERIQFGAPERECLDYLAKMAARIGSAYALGAQFTLIQTDTHANLNNYCPVGTDAYHEAVAIEARDRGFLACKLSALVEGFVADPDEAPPEPDLLQALAHSAGKHYRGEGGAEAAAERYYFCNMVEKRAVESAFPDAVFVTFNGSEVRALFPQKMPIFYMYSLRRGFAVKPWFMDDEGADV